MGHSGKTAPGRFLFSKDGIDGTCRGGGTQKLGVQNTSSRNQPLGYKRIEEKLLAILANPDLGAFPLGTCKTFTGTQAEYAAMKNQERKVYHNVREIDYTPWQEGLSKADRYVYRARYYALQGVYKACKAEGVDSARFVEEYASQWRTYRPELHLWLMANRTNRKVLIKLTEGPGYPDAEPKNLAPGEVFEKYEDYEGIPRNKVEYKNKKVDGVKQQVVAYVPSSISGLPNRHPLEVAQERLAAKRERERMKNIEEGTLPPPRKEPKVFEFAPMTAPTVDNVRGAYLQHTAYDRIEVRKGDQYEKSMYGVKVK